MKLSKIQEKYFIFIKKCLKGAKPFHTKSISMPFGGYKKRWKL